MATERTTALLKIGDLARRTGKSVRALHLYEEMGLLQPVARTAGGFRLFDEEALRRIRWIELLQETGMSLHQIGELLRSWWEQPHGPGAMEGLRSVFQAKLQEARDQARKYEALAAELDSSIRYLETCRSCSAAPAVETCTRCPVDHAMDREPMLVAGLHLKTPAPRAGELLQIEPEPDSGRGGGRS